ncbi:MAG: hypothetical protein ACI9ON_002450 [Limisphaerales bacterium]|jgi:hypothetical protein
MTEVGESRTEISGSRTEISGSRYSAEVKVTARRNIEPIVVAGAGQLIAASTHNSVLANLNVRLRDIERPAYTIESGTNPSG